MWFIKRNIFFPNREMGFVALKLPWILATLLSFTLRSSISQVLISAFWIIWLRTGLQNTGPTCILFKTKHEFTFNLILFNVFILLATLLCNLHNKNGRLYPNAQYH